MIDTITREKIDYLVCRNCGVVFPDRDDPKTCPICEAGSSTFASYDDKSDE